MKQRHRVSAAGNADEQAAAARRLLQPWDFRFKRHGRTVPEIFPTSIEYFKYASVEDRESTNPKDMKTSLIITAAIAAITLLGSTTSADARHKHRRNYNYEDSYRSCDTSVYRERYFIGYDRCGYPVWGYRTVRSYCPPPRAYCPPPRPYYRPAVCPPRYPYYEGRPCSGVVISGVFGF
jgi:hypothetical protein